MRSDPLTAVHTWDQDTGVHRGRPREEGEGCENPEDRPGTTPSHAAPKVDPADSFILDF